jgi:hypothetical protein
MNDRIIYVMRPRSFPFGGAKGPYRHVEILHQKGFPAFMALPRKPKVDFYESKAPLLIFGSWFMNSRAAIRRAARPGDIWVVPEAFMSYLRALANTPVKRIMICQSQWALTFPADPKAGIAEFGADDLLVTTENQMQFFRDVYGVSDIPYIQGYEVDTRIFRPAAQKKRQIAFMPRKLPVEARFLEATFKRRHARYADVPWISVDHLPQSEVARILGESAVFLGLSHWDSLGLPPLEAMASGCLCAGYYGDGGRTYMTKDNGWWANDKDWLACIDALASAIGHYDGTDGDPAPYYRAMAHTVEQYSPERLEKTLVDYWRRELETPFP